MYGGEGFQNMETGFISADGSTMLIGQDMGGYRLSVAEDIMAPGMAWTHIAAKGVNMSGRWAGNIGCAIDPEDTDVMILGFQQVNGALYRSTDRGATVTKVTPDFDAVQMRDYRFPMVCWPMTGGSPDTRRWLYVAGTGTRDNSEGSAGIAMRSTDGGQSWSQIATLPWATYNAIFTVAQDPHDRDHVYIACKNTGIWRSTDEGAHWARPGWSATAVGGGSIGQFFESDCRSMWIDPTDTDRFVVACSSSDASLRGLWLTENNGNSWRRLYSELRVCCAAVGCPDPNRNQERLVWLKVFDNNPVVGRFSSTWNQIGSWVVTDNLAMSTSWNHAEIQHGTDDNQWLLASPTVPEMCIMYVRSVMYYARPGTDGQRWLPGNGFFGSVAFALAFNESNWREMALSHTDQGTAISDSGYESAWNNQISAAMIDYIGQNLGSSKKCLGLVWLPDPWPTGVPAPAQNNAPGRMITSAGSGSAGLILGIQNKAQRDTPTVHYHDWTDFLDLSVAAGGGTARRRFVAYSYQNPNKVYAGANKSTDAGLTWSSCGREVVAMDYDDGDIVYGISDGEQTLSRSTNGASTWSEIHTFDFELDSHNHFGRVWTFPGRRDRLLIAHQVGGADDLAILRLNPGTGALEGSLIDLNIRSYLAPEAPADDLSSAAICRYSPRWIAVMWMITGADGIFLVHLNPTFDGVESVENIHLNAPRIWGNGRIFNFSPTGDWVMGGGQGTWVYPAPDDWTHDDPAKQGDHRALFRSCARAINGNWV